MALAAPVSVRRSRACSCPTSGRASSPLRVPGHQCYLFLLAIPFSVYIRHGAAPPTQERGPPPKGRFCQRFRPAERSREPGAGWRLPPVGCGKAAVMVAVGLPVSPMCRVSVRRSHRIRVGRYPIFPARELSLVAILVTDVQHVARNQTSGAHGHALLRLEGEPDRAELYAA